MRDDSGVSRRTCAPGQNGQSWSHMRHGSLRFSLSIALLGYATTLARAQHVRGADLLTRSEVADSPRVLADLDARVRANPDDASVWFHRGMVA